MKAAELWSKFCSEKGIDVNTPYESWQFGGDPDKLADLVVKGIKTATASAYDLYFVEGEEEPVPEEDMFSVILDSCDEAVCVIMTTRVYVVPFDEVSREHAYLEGEGDRSLQYWREVHEEFFNDCYAETDLTFNYKSKVVCEEFKMIYKA